MYNILQLREKELSELQSIAQSMGINPKTMEKDKLIYAILDEQAISGSRMTSDSTQKNQKPIRKREQNKNKVEKPVAAKNTNTKTVPYAKYWVKIILPRPVNTSAPKVPVTSAIKLNTP